MKIKPLISILLSILSIQSFAQLNKGRCMLNGRALYASTRSDEETVNSSFPSKQFINNNVLFNLNAGYFVTNKLAIGVTGGLGKQVSIASSKSFSGERNVDKSVTSTFFTGIFARYNQPFGESKFGLFLQADSRINWGNIEDHYERFNSSNVSVDGWTNKQKNNGYSTSLAPGIFYFITNRLSIELNFGNVSYTSNTFGERIVDNVHESTSGFKIDLSTNSYFLGLTFYLGGTKTEKQ